MFTLLTDKAHCINVTYCSLTNISNTQYVFVAVIAHTHCNVWVLLHCHCYIILFLIILFGTCMCLVLYSTFNMCSTWPVEPCGVPAAALSDTFCVQKHLSALGEKMLVFLQSLPWVLERKCRGWNSFYRSWFLLTSPKNKSLPTAISPQIPSIIIM